MNEIFQFFFSNCDETNQFFKCVIQNIYLCSFVSFAVFILKLLNKIINNCCQCFFATIRKFFDNITINLQSDFNKTDTKCLNLIK